MKLCRGHANGRGNTYDRFARKIWLLSPAAGFGGDGRRVPCRWCGRKLTRSRLTVDRWPICGHQGGRYVRGNIVPSCGRCNQTRCSWRGAVCNVGRRPLPEMVAELVVEVAHAHAG